MPKKTRRTQVARGPLVHHHTVLTLGLVIVAVALFAAMYFAVTEQSLALGEQTIGSVNGRLNVVDWSFLSTNKLKYGKDKNTDFIRSLATTQRVIPLSAVNFKNALEVGNQFVKDYARFFGVGNSRELVPQTTKKDELGMSHIAYQQKINGVPVFGAEMLVHVKDDFSVKSAAGKLLANTAVNTAPKISARAAGNVVKRFWKKQFSGQGPRILAGKLYVFNKNLLDARFADKNYLVWEVKANDAASGRSETYYIDARNGQLVLQITNVKSINRRVYNCGSNRERGMCSTLYGFDADQRQNDRAEGWSAVNTGDVDSVYQMVGQAHNYFETVHGTDGANASDGAGNSVDGHPRLRTDVYANWLIPNSWDSDCPNSFFLENKLMFCPTTVSLGVVGHEYSHAVSNFYGRGLVYAFESGAIEEGIADIMGQGVENFVNGAPTWRINLTPGNLLRNFANPSSLNLPDRYYSPNFYCGNNDSGGVHTNSNVVSHAAYLLSTGANFNGCSLQSIGFDKVERIFFRALDRYLLANAGFNDLYWALDNACSDLYEDTDCARMRRALQAVEIDQAGPCGGGETPAPRPTCAPPYIISASANAGYYRADQSINLLFKFSRPVRSAEPVGVLAHLGGANVTSTVCTLNLSEITDTAECSFKVQEGNNAARFRLDGLEPVVKRPIIDEDLSAITNLAPEQNLSKGQVVIDTEPPLGAVNINNSEAVTNLTSVTLAHNARDNNSGVEYYRVSNDGEHFSRWLPYTINSVWNLYNVEAGGGEEPSAVGRYLRRVYAQFKDKAGNMSKAVSDEIFFSPLVLELRTQSFQSVSTSSSSAEQQSGLRAVDTRANTVFAATNTVSSPVATTSPASATPTVSYSLPGTVQIMAREPDFTLSTKPIKLTTYLSGIVNYWGKGGSCESARPTNPIIVRWGDGSVSTPTTKDKNFSILHTYKISGTYSIIVTLTNNCSGYTIKRLTVNIAT